MRLDLLSDRANRISQLNEQILPMQKPQKILFRENWIIPEMRFNCSTNITGVTVGASLALQRQGSNNYPEIQIWKYIKKNDTYRIVGRRKLIIEAYQFSNTGVYRYKFPTPLSVKGGEVIGIDTGCGLSIGQHIHLYYLNSSDAPTVFQKATCTPENGTAYLNSYIQLENRYLLLTPIMGKHGIS